MFISGLAVKGIVLAIKLAISATANLPILVCG